MSCLSCVLDWEENLCSLSVQGEGRRTRTPGAHCMCYAFAMMTSSCGLDFAHDIDTQQVQLARAQVSASHEQY